MITPDWADENQTAIRLALRSKATTYTSGLGYAPRIITTPILSPTVELAGNALPDLWITVLHPGLGSFDARVARLSGRRGHSLSAREARRHPAGGSVRRRDSR